VPSCRCVRQRAVRRGSQDEAFPIITAPHTSAGPREVEEGKIYTGKVVKVEDFGCFVELWPGCEGMVHISHLDTKRVEKTEDIVKLGDEIIVKAIGYDKKGRLSLSRKEALKPEVEPEKTEKAE
jgi:polyribonucleotide nucleotidyltransferase